MPEIKYRYFIVFFSVRTDTKAGNGHTSFQMNDTYINQKEAVSRIVAKTEYNKNQITITGVNEVSEEDYIEWNR